VETWPVSGPPRSVSETEKYTVLLPAGGGARNPFVELEGKTVQKGVSGPGTRLLR